MTTTQAATQATETKATGSKKGADKPAEQPKAARTHSKVIVVKLAAILADWKRNAREQAYDPNDKREKAEWEAFKADIEEHGLLEPLLLSPRKEATKAGQSFDLDAGFRRYTAMTELGWTDAPCVIRESGSALDSMAVNLSENLARKDLHPAEAVQGLVKFRDACVKAGLNATGAFLSSKVGKSKSHVNNMIRINDALIKPALRAFYDKKVPIETAIRWAGMDKAEQESAWKGFLDGQNGGEGGEESGEGGAASTKPKTLNRAGIEELLGKLESAEGIKVKGGDEVDLSSDETMREVIRAVLGYILKPKTPTGNDRNPFKYAPEDAEDDGE